MNKWHELMGEFQVALTKFLESDTIQRLQQNSLGPRHYEAILRQIFHHARENPQIQAMATVYFRGAQRDMIKRFYVHASSEIGHDKLALNDLAEMGVDVRGIPEEYPLPATVALLGYAFYQIQNHNPIGYLGYLLFLEFTPTSIGESLLKRLDAIGISSSATSFLQDHTTIDVGHNKLMEKYVDALVQTKADVSAVKYAIRTTGRLYAAMLDDAVASVDQEQSPQLNYEEIGRVA